MLYTFFISYLHLFIFMRIKDTRVLARRKRRFFLHLRWGILIVLAIGILVFIFVSFLFIFRKSSLLSPVTSLYFKDIGVVDGGQKVLVVRNLLQDNSVIFVDVFYQNGVIYLIPEKGQVVLLSPDKDLAVQIASLQRITSQLTIEGKHFTRLDFRFDKPVIVF